jgi:membrane-bound lytic murein transglycosylase B
MKKTVSAVLLILSFFFVTAQEIKVTYDQPRFDALYKTVSKHYKKDELKALLQSSEVADIDTETEKNLKFIFHPLSVKKQALKHEEFIAKLVNEETVKQGVEFFAKYNKVLEETYKKTKVHPADIIAIINWESRLGAFTGTQQVIKIFTGQYFFAEKYNDLHLKEGSYDLEGAMSREGALKRIERLKRNALGNLAALLVQAKLKNFDPAAVRGSWAGAIGYPQFMPASMRYAVDGNNDGKIDLFTMEDAIASVANYLKENGYHSKGREHSFKRYNPDRIYAKGVKMYGDMARKAGIEPGKCPKTESACPIDL